MGGKRFLFTPHKNSCQQAFVNINLNLSVINARIQKRLKRFCVPPPFIVLSKFTFLINILYVVSRHAWSCCAARSIPAPSSLSC